MPRRHVASSRYSNFARIAHRRAHAIAKLRQLHPRDATVSVRGRDTLVSRRKKTHGPLQLSCDGRVPTDNKVGGEIFQLVAPDIEHDITGIDWRVELLQEIWRAHDQAGTTVAACPRHAVKLKLNFPLGGERVGGVQDA
eukprot:6208032-Pleurochrysis_carterae.AAC.2